MATTLISYPHGVRLIRLRIRPLAQTEMSIGHSNVHSSIGQTEMSIGHPNVHSSIGRMDERTLSNGNHSSLLSTWGQAQSDYVITASLAL